MFAPSKLNDFVSRVGSVSQYIFKVDTQNLFLEKQSLRLPTDKLILIGLPFLLPNPYTVHATECMWQRCCPRWFHSATLPQKKYFQNSDQHNWWTACHLPKYPRKIPHAGFHYPINTVYSPAKIFIWSASFTFWQIFFDFSPLYSSKVITRKEF